MNISVNRIFSYGLLAAALSFGASYASAQQVTFHLPSETHWGRAVLESGDYKMSGGQASLGQTEFLVRGDSGSAFELPLVTDTQRESNSSYLQLVNINGTYYVDEYVSGPSGKTYKFALPKAARHQEMARAGGTIVAVTDSDSR